MNATCTAMLAIVATMVALHVSLSSGRVVSEPESCNSFNVMEKLLDKMVRVEFKMETFEATMLRWEAKMDAWQTRLDAAETQLQAKSEANNEALTNALQKHGETLETAARKLDAEVGEKLATALRNNQDEMRTFQTNANDSLVAAWKRLETGVAVKLDGALQKHKADLEAVREAYPTPTVMFMARDVTNNDVVKGETIVLTTEVTNVGDGYDQTTGLFTAPYEGMYIFTVNMCAFENKEVNVHLIAAGTRLASINKHNVDKGYTCSSASGMTTLNKGDTASVQGVFSQTAAIITGGENNWPSFSGMLVRTT